MLSTTSLYHKWRRQWVRPAMDKRSDNIFVLRRSFSQALQYAQRAENFNNVWNPNTTFPGREDIAGFMQVIMIFFDCGRERCLMLYHIATIC